MISQKTQSRADLRGASNYHASKAPVGGTSPAGPELAMRYLAVRTRETLAVEEA
jgi:hypothetical protein